MATARLEDFDFEELLGHGSFCQVERVVREGRSYAAKRVVKSKPWVLQAIRRPGARRASKRGRF